MQVVIVAVIAIDEVDAIVIVKVIFCYYCCPFVSCILSECDVGVLEEFLRDIHLLRDLMMMISKQNLKVMINLLGHLELQENSLDALYLS